MKKNDWVVRRGMEMLFTCCLLSFAALGVHAACSGDDYCGADSVGSASCAGATIQQNSDEQLVCTAESFPDRPVNCNKKNPSQEQKCDSCSCKSKNHPNNPSVGEQCSCQ